MMIFEVELSAFHRPERPGTEVRVRQVDVPDREVDAAGTVEAVLERVFYYGQNDFQPLPLPSVSVGDVVRVPILSLPPHTLATQVIGKRYIVMPFGFEEIALGDPVGHEAAYDRAVSRPGSGLLPEDYDGPARRSEAYAEETRRRMEDV